METAEHHISLKDVYGEVKALGGQVSTLVQLATRVTDIEKEVLLLKERGINRDGTLTQIVKDIKENEKQNRRILIYIGVTAILSGIFGQSLISKLTG